MDLREALRATPATREFADDPIDDDTIAAILDDARFAPSGGNRQAWRVIVVKDRVTRRQLGTIMARAWSAYAAQMRAGETPFSPLSTSKIHGNAPPPHPPNPLLDNIETVPALLVLAADLRLLAAMDLHSGRMPLVSGASVYPFAHNIVLAARDRGPPPARPSRSSRHRRDHLPRPSGHDADPSDAPARRIVHHARSLRRRAVRMSVGR
jgi:nitroreductase